MMKRRTLLLGAAATLAAPAVHAQGWPNGQPIRIIIPYPPGAANDAMGRLAAQKLQDKLGATAAEVPKHVALLKKAGFVAQ
jgi:tripartite-type tricarboxylate transporter receptor subunit TctC